MPAVSGQINGGVRIGGMFPDSAQVSSTPAKHSLGQTPAVSAAPGENIQRVLKLCKVAGRLDTYVLKLTWLPCTLLQV